MYDIQPAPLAAKVRGSAIEDVHWGHVAVVDSKGNLLKSVGSPDKRVSYFRSTAKPFQALTSIISGAYEHYGFSEKELAIICGSHMCHDYHVATVKGMLKKIGVSEDALYCGLKHGCSGKHTGFLAVAQHNKWPLKGYLEPDHPVQQMVVKILASLCETDVSQISMGVENCGATTWGFTLAKIAGAYAQLSGQGVRDPALTAPIKMVSDAMTREPHMVRGHGGFCTSLIQAGNGRLIGKYGGSGIYCISVLDQGIGITVKIEDGSLEISWLVALEVVRQLGLVDLSAAPNLGVWHDIGISNLKGNRCGTVEILFSL